MSTRILSVYQAPQWGSRIVRTATISQDSDGTYYVDKVRVADVRKINLFSVLACADGTTHNVLTGFLRLVHHDPAPEEIL